MCTSPEGPSPPLPTWGHSSPWATQDPPGLSPEAHFTAGAQGQRGQGHTVSGWALASLLPSGSPPILHSPLLGSLLLGPWPPPQLRGAGKLLPQQPERLALGSLFSAHRSVWGLPPPALLLPQHLRLPFKAFGGRGLCYSPELLPQSHCSPVFGPTRMPWLSGSPSWSSPALISLMLLAHVCLLPKVH